MKRDPGLHVTKSILREVIRDIVGEHIDYEGITNYIFSKCRGKSIHHRSIIMTDEAMQKKVSRVLLSGADDTSLFSTLLVTCRRKLKHKGISQAKPMSKDWLILKEITAKALQFCEDFGLPRREGFIKYIEIGLSRIQKFNLNRLNSMSESISNIYEAIEELKSDTTPQLTIELYKYYNKLVVGRSGIAIDYSNFPEKMVAFFRIKLVARDCRVDSKTYIDAQFRAFEYNNSIPEPTQMVGDKAKIRLTKHLYNIGGETITEEAPKRDWKKILNS